MARELYLILGIAERAPESEIRKAYRRLARKYHPDINPGDRSAEELFKRISEAYAVLGDTEKRGFYDSNGYYTEGVLESERVSQWDFSFRSEVQSGSEGFGDVLDGFLRQGTPAGEDPPDSNDVECGVSLTFEDSLKGLVTDVEISRKRRCRVCLGSGRGDRPSEQGNRPSEQGGRTSDESCRSCAGSGRRTRTTGHLSFSTTCSECRGTGRVRTQCPECGGHGRTERKERVRVDLPAGVSSGSRLRFAGKGHADPGTRSRGDLFVVTQVETHPFFRRAGDNLYCTLPVTISEAALGAKIQVPTVDGPALLRVPPGVQSGQALRLRGRGAPSLRGDGVRGDQYVEVQVVVPRVVDERSRELLRELARLHPEDPRKELDTDAG